MVVEREDQYQPFLVLALILLVAEMLIRRKDRPKTAIIGCLAAFVLFTGFFETAQDTVKKGNDQFQNKRYQSALEDYRKVQVKNPDAPEVLYDLGTTLYKVDSFQESAKDLETAQAKAQDSKLKARTLYNYGNAQYRLGDFEKAIDSYKKALALDPTDKDSKYNLEFLQKRKSKIDKKDQDKKQDQKKQDQKQNQKNKDQSQQQQNQGQGQQDQQNQGQGQQQDQNNPQNKDQKDQKEQGQGQQEQKDQQPQPKPQDQKNQKDQQDKDQKDQQQKDQEQKDQEQKEKEQQAQQQREQEEQAEKDKEEQGKQDQQPQDQQGPKQGQQKQPLQGQMSMDNALNLLDALKESEKELQDLRRPPVNKSPPPVDKDW